MPRQQTGKHAQWPTFQGFRHQGVVGVSEGSAGDGPGLIPIQLVFIHQDAHQLGDGNGWMSVVELDGKFFMKFLQWDLLHPNDAHHVL